MVEVALLVAVFAARTADLPPGAVLRLGDARWRNGGAVFDLALSPDGKRFVTVRPADLYEAAVTVWDAGTGRPVRSGVVNGELLRGVAWGPGGAAAVIRRADPAGPGRGRGRLFPDDFRVWDFADPNAPPPPVLPIAFGGIGCCAQPARVDADRPGGGPEYTAFAPSGDGSRVAAVRKGGDGRYRLDVFEMKPAATAGGLARVRSLDLGAAAPTDVLVSHDGRTVAAAHRPPWGEHARTRARAWDVETGRAGELFEYPGWVARGGLSPGGRLLAAVDDRGALRFLDPMTGREREAEVRLPAGPDGDDRIYGNVAFWPDGRRLVAAADRGAVVVDVPGRKALAFLGGHAGGASAVAVSADGTRVATADGAGLIRVWDAATYRPLDPAAGHRARVEHAELSPDGNRLVTWAADETVRVWDLKTGREVRAFAGAVGVGEREDVLRTDRPAFAPDGLSVLFSTKDRLVRRDVTTGLEVPLPAGLAELGPAFAVFAPDGTAVLTWATRRPVTVWDWPAGRKRFTAEEVREPEAAGFSPDGSVVFAGESGSDRWDAKTGKPVPARAAEEQFYRSGLQSLRPNPRLLAYQAGEEGLVVEAGTGKPVPGVRLAWAPAGPPSSDGVSGAALSPAGRQFAQAVYYQPGIKVYEAATGEVRRTLPGHQGYARVLGFTPDGSRLLTAGADHTVLVWDVRPQSMPLPDAVRREASAAKLWATMATGKADAAYLAMARFAAEPDAAVRTARMRMRPATAPDAATLDKLLRRLSDPDYAVREATERELDGYGEPAAELVRARLTKLESPEARRRAEGFVVRWAGAGREGQRLADARAVELMEALGTPAAREFLKELAAGEATAFRTQEAKRAVERQK